MKIVVAGSSGFLGTALRRALADRGHDVVRLVRHAASTPDEVEWDPYVARLDPEVIEDADVVVNLAGSPTAGNPHSQAWARDLRSSRLTTTSVLAQAIARSEAKPAFLAGNGISYYGDRGAEPLTEDDDSRGDSLLTALTREWQAATDVARDAGARVCILRTAPVLEKDHPPLKQVLLTAKLGLGAKLGDGGQYFPVISLHDWVDAVTWLAEHDDCSGAFNLCCPITPTNAEFTDAVAEAVGRKARLAIPKAVIKVGAGAMAPEVLGSTNARPEALERAGFAFRDTDVRAVVRAGLQA